MITDATEPNTANTIVNYIQSIIQHYQEELNASSNQGIDIQVQTRMFYNTELKSVFNFVPGVMTVILMLVSAMMTSISITREKELGTMEILLVSPLKPIQVVVGKVFPYIFLSIINALVILILGVTIFGMPIEGSVILLALETVLVHNYCTRPGNTDLHNCPNSADGHDDLSYGIDATGDPVI